MNPIDSQALESLHWMDRMVRLIRRSSWLHKFSGVWNCLRPLYDVLLVRLYPQGFAWTINETEVLRLSPRMRSITTDHEPAAWRQLMAAFQPNDCAVDVGANFGLYGITWAKRAKENARIVAFEPDPESFALLEENLRLNHVGSRVQCVRAAAGSKKGDLVFIGRLGPLSHPAAAATPDSISVPCVRLDAHFASQKVDIIKIDVEGYEEEALLGAEALLSDRARGPRLIYLELHPWAWARCGVSTTRESIEALLKRHGYRLSLPEGNPGAFNEGWEWMARR